MPIKITHIQHTNKQDRTPLTRQVEDREKRKQQVTAYKKKRDNKIQNLGNNVQIGRCHQ